MVNIARWEISLKVIYVEGEENSIVHLGSTARSSENAFEPGY